MPRKLEWPDCLNCRDMGGLKAGKGRRIRTGALFRADDIGRLTSDSWLMAMAEGVRTIVDLRDDVEAEFARRSMTRQRCTTDKVTMVPVPIRSLGTPTSRRVLSRTLDKEEQYRVLLDQFRCGIAAACAAFAGAEDGAVLVHCTAGRDRTGVVVAVLLAAAGVSAEDIAADYALSRECLYPRYEAVMNQIKSASQRKALLAENASPPEAMLGALAHLRGAWGGAEAYLVGAGLKPAQLERIGSRLLEPD